MSYMVEGYIGEFALPVNATATSLLFKIVPTGEYVREQSNAGKVTKQTLLIAADKALLVDGEKSFTVEVKDVRELIPSIVALKTTKTKIRVECDVDRKVSSITVL